MWKRSNWNQVEQARATGPDELTLAYYGSNCLQLPSKSHASMRALESKTLPSCQILMLSSAQAPLAVAPGLHAWPRPLGRSVSCYGPWSMANADHAQTRPLSGSLQAVSKHHQHTLCIRRYAGHICHCSGSLPQGGQVSPASHMLSEMASLMTTFFPVWICISCLLGLWKPALWAWFSPRWVTWALAVSAP